MFGTLSFLHFKYIETSENPKAGSKIVHSLSIKSKSSMTKNELLCLQYSFLKLGTDTNAVSKCR